MPERASRVPRLFGRLLRDFGVLAAGVCRFTAVFSEAPRKNPQPAAAIFGPLRRIWWKSGGFRHGTSVAPSADIMMQKESVQTPSTTATLTPPAALGNAVTPISLDERLRE